MIITMIMLKCIIINRRQCGQSNKLFFLNEMEAFGERQEFPGKNVRKLVSDDNRITRRGGNYLLGWKLFPHLNP